MKSHFLGFIIDFQSEELKFDGFMKDLARSLSHNIGPSDTPKSRKLFIHTKNKDFYIGMIITIKDQKKFCQGDLSQSDFSFDVVNLKTDNKILEFNYFIINKKSNYGLFQYYHQSCSASRLNDRFKKLLYQYKERQTNNAIRKAQKQNATLSQSAIKKIRKKYQAKLQLDIIVQQEKLEEILNEYKKIKAFEFEYITLTPKIRQATPLSPHVEKKREKLTFSSPTNVVTLAKSITEFVNTDVLKMGNIKAEDKNDEEISLRIFNMPDYFAIYEFDELADKLADIKTSSFYHSDIVQLLIQCHNKAEYSHIFQQ